MSGLQLQTALPSLNGSIAKLEVGLQSGADQATGALYANLANALFATIYAKLLIPRLGT